VILATSFLQNQNFIDVLYIVAFSLFIYGLMGLTGPKTAVRGNRIAAVGMAIAIVATLLTKGMGNWALIAIGIAIGTAVGIPAALKVRMTAMPQMVALFNGVGGGAVALIAWAEFRNTHGFSTDATYVAIFELFAAIVGSISFWGSNIAFGKLQEILPGRPITIGRAQSLLNLVLLLVCIASAVFVVSGTHPEILFILGILVAAALLGNFVVLPIGGADMPVVISLLNAFTGLSAAATGVALNNPALIVAGMIVGASGSILTNLMAQAMNRSIPSIVAGGFGGAVALPGGGADDADRTVRSTSASDAAIQMAYASQVAIVPGYGMAVAQAQHAVREMTKLLEAKGVEVYFAIHPVAGRMPGHMNVLLAEADVPYDELKEMEDANQLFSRTDVALVIGANDVTNPAANDQPDSPIYGMPILEVDHSKSVIVLKRSMSSGFAGIDNPLFYDAKTAMLFGDAKSSVQDITTELQAL
jgi:proton-translocating NAD(P)+ transhydrogenase subunit beta